MKKNNWLFIFSLLTVMAILLSSCATPTPPPTAAPTQPPAPEATQPPAAAPTQAPEPTKAAPQPTSVQVEVTPAGKKILRVGYNAEIDILNALTSQNLTDIEVTMVEGLIISNDKNTYIPVLAKEITTTLINSSK